MAEKGMSCQKFLLEATYLGLILGSASFGITLSQLVSDF